MVTRSRRAQVKNNKRVGITGGNTIKDKDTWSHVLAAQLERHKATEVVLPGSFGDYTLIAEGAAAITGVPNVILSGPVAMEERASMLIVLPGQSAKTTAIAKLFREHNKKVFHVLIEGGE